MDTMRTRTQALFAVAALLAAGAAPARGQDAASDPRWLAYLGCWEPSESAKSVLCVVPAAGASAVDFVTVVKGQVTTRERIAATGERVETGSGDCTGWRSAEWSGHGQRLYLRAEDTCAGATARGGTGVIAMSADGRWLYIQSATVAGQTGLRVERYRAARGDVVLPDDVLDAVRLGVAATIKARAAAAAPLSTDDVVEASRKVDTAVLEAWLMERAEPFTLDANRLIALADGGVPAQVIDLMVALSYPKVFAINAASRQGERRAGVSGRGTDPVSAYRPSDPFCSSFDLMYPYASYDCSGLGYGYRYGYDLYGTGYRGWYPGGYPVIIVYTGSPSGGPRPHGRVVNGRGYRDGAVGTPEPAARPREPTAQTRGGSTGTPSSGGTSSSSGSGEQRTAKPRPPQ